MRAFITAPAATLKATLWFVGTVLVACAPAAHRSAPPVAAQQATAAAIARDHATPPADPAQSATANPLSPAATDNVDPAQHIETTEECENACMAASAERSASNAQSTDEAKRQCPNAPKAARTQCLAVADKEAAERQYEEEGNQHACRTNCPGYLDQF